MHLTQDFLYNAADPNASPCRWYISLYDCQDSRYFVVVTAASLLLSAVTVVAGGVLTFLLVKHQGMAFHPSKWPTSRFVSIATLVTASFQTISTAVLLYDAPFPYWILMLIFILPYMSGYISLVPYLLSLMSTRLLDRAARPIQIPYQRYIRILVFLIPAGFMLSGILFSLSASFLEEGKRDLFTGFFSSGHALIAFICGIITVVCMALGRVSARTMEEHLLESIPPAPPPLYTPPLRHEAQPQMRIEDIALAERIHETQQILQKMRHLNTYAALSGTGTATSCLIMAIIPNEIHSISGLSMAMFTVFNVAVTIFPLLISVKFLYEELSKPSNKFSAHLFLDAITLPEPRSQHGHSSSDGSIPPLEKTSTPTPTTSHARHSSHNT